MKDGWTNFSEKELELLFDNDFYQSDGCSSDKVQWRPFLPKDLNALDRVVTSAAEKPAQRQQWWIWKWWSDEDIVSYFPSEDEEKDKNLVAIKKENSNLADDATMELYQRVR